MNIQKLQELKHHIDFTKLLTYSGNTSKQKDEGLMWQCPFHAGGTDYFLEVDTIKKQASCSWCEKSWSMFDYIKELKNLTDDETLNYLEKYHNESSPKLKYEIATLTKHEIIIMIEDREYQLTGVKLKTLNSFSMTIKLSYNYKFFICDVNLSRIKSRYDFIQEAKDYLFISEDLLKEDVVLLMEAVGKLQRENIKRLEEEDKDIQKSFKYSEEEENKAIAYLSSHDILLEDLVKDTEKLGYVGDKLGKIILYLACTSRKLKKPISVLSVANSSAGKSFAQDNILSLMPDDELYSFTRLTPMSMSHFGKDALSHSILCVDEFSGVEEEAMYQVRSLLSKGKLSLAYTSIDHKSGRMVTKTKEVKGPVAFITSTTHEELIDDETRSRYIILKIDESKEQTVRVMKSMIKNHTKEGTISAGEKEKILRKYKIIQKALRPVEVYIPQKWQDKITFYNKRISFKRKFGSYLSLLFTVALHRQYQKKILVDKDKAGNHFEYIYVDKKDIVFANSIIKELFGSSLGDLNPVNQKMMEDIIFYCKEKAKATKLHYTEINFARKEIRDFAGWEHRPLRRAFEKLQDMEYIVRVYGVGNGQHYYRLNISDDESGDFNLNLWTPTKG